MLIYRPSKVNLFVLRRVDTDVDICSSSSSSVFESSLDLNPRKLTKVTNGTFFINQLANVVNATLAYYVSDDKYDTKYRGITHILFAVQAVKFATKIVGYR